MLDPRLDRTWMVPYYISLTFYIAFPSKMMNDPSFPLPSLSQKQARTALGWRWPSVSDTNTNQKEAGNEVVLRGTNCPRHISQGTIIYFPKTPTNPLLFIVKILQNEQSNARTFGLSTNLSHSQHHTACLDTKSNQNQDKICKQIQHRHFYH